MCKNWYKRIGYALVLMLAVLMLTGTKAYATEDIQLPIMVNPLYQEDTAEIEVELESLQGETLEASSDVVYTSVDEAAAYVRQQMAARNTSIVFKMSYDLYEEYGSDVFNKVFYDAIEHTEECSGQEGDALAFGWTGRSMSISISSNVMTVTMPVSYYTTAEQEAALTTAVNSAMTSLNLSGKTDYEKVKAIYSYICDRVDYDYENLEDDSYTLKYSAYAAMVDKKAVCQGYAILFYRMCKEAGVPVRIISGYGHNEAHAWNIVKVGNYYYNVDCTWDGQDAETYSNYFLKSELDFVNHTRASKYDTAEFHNQYVMSSESYGAEGEIKEGANVSNYNYTYTTTNDTTVTSAANGKPKVLIFYNTTCYYSQTTFSNLQKVTLNNVDIVAVDCAAHTKDQVATFATNYGSNNIQFCYDTTQSVSSPSMWNYVYAGMGDVSSIYYPVIVYIDGNNKIQYATSGMQTGNQVRNCLMTYCGYTGELSLSEQSIALVTGDSHTVSAYVDGQKYNGESFTWTSSNTKVATVDEAGKITATGAGSATITCKASNGTTLTVAVTVKAKLSLSNSSVSVVAGNSSTVTVYADGVKSSGSNYTWTSSNTKVATVDTTGKITGVAAGSATITCKASDGRTLTVAVTVKAKLRLSSSTASLITGDSSTITVYADGVKSSGSNYTWTSSNTKVATVDSTGKITATGAGSATITCKASDGRTLTVAVTVKAKLTLSGSTVSLITGNSSTVTVYADGVKSSASNYTWTSSNTKFAKVDTTGKITGVAAGSATITCKASDGRTLTVAVTVKAKLTLSSSTASLITGNSSTVTVYADGVKSSASNYTWTSSNTKVATVDSTGKITAIGAGSATITCKASDGRTLTVAVTVKAKLSLSSSKISVSKGSSSTVTVYADGVKSSASNYTWTSSNTKIAKVDTAGKITGVAEGSATITCKASDGRTLTVAVTVTAAKENGLIYTNGKYIWYTDGVKDTSKTGLVPFDGQWFYIVKGEMSNYNGFVEYDGEIFYIAAGRMVAEASGLVEYNGEWYFVASGRVVSEYTGLAEYNGAWFYVANGKMDTTKKGMVEYNGGLFYVGAGKIMKDVSGLAQDPVTKKWYFIADGQVQKQHTGLALYDGKWFYVIKGEFANTYTGYVTYNGSKFYVVKGEVQL